MRRKSVERQQVPANKRKPSAIDAIISQFHYYLLK